MKNSQVTQALVNTYPEWSDVRSDTQSFGYSFLNGIGNQVEDLYKQLVHAEKNHYIALANLNDIDVVNTYQLPGNFNFTVINNNPINPIYDPITVTGIVNLQSYSIQLADNNDIESFWYDSIPNRFSTTSFPVTNIFNDNSSNPVYGGVLSTTVKLCPVITSIILDKPATKIWIQTTGGTQYIYVDDNSILVRGTIKITGLTRSGNIEEEVLIFLHDDIQQTKNDWSEIYKIEALNIIPDTTYVQVYAHKFGRTSNPQIQAPKDFYNLISAPSSKEQIDTFWEISTANNGSSILQMKHWSSDLFINRIAGFVTLDIFKEIELLNTSGAPITSATDLAIQPFSNKIWIADQTKIYLYDNQVDIPNTNLTPQKQFNAMSIMVLSNDSIISGDTVVVDYFWRRQLTDIVKHRVDIINANGTRQNIINGSFSSYDPTNWVIGTPNNNKIRSSDTFTFTTRGSYILTLTVVYADGTTEIDQRVITTATKTAIQQFDFSGIIGSAILTGIDFDSDQNLWVLVNTSGTYTKLKVNLFTDIMMIDYIKKTIYLKETYDNIIIA